MKRKLRSSFKAGHAFRSIEISLGDTSASGPTIQVSTIQYRWVRGFSKKSGHWNFAQSTTSGNWSTDIAMILDRGRAPLASGEWAPHPCCVGFYP